MRKFILLFLILPFAFTLCGCEEQNPYVKYVSDLQQDIYSGEIDGVHVTAVYGFREYPFINDGTAGEPVYGYVFKLDIIPDDVHRSIEFENDGKTYGAAFELDKVTSEYKARVEIEKHFENGFTVNFIRGSEKTPVTLDSVIPENCLNFEQALLILLNEQKSLIDAYTTNGVFNAELYMRVFVKNGAPYWYVGIASGNDKLKALLIDGTTGKLIAVREIF